MDLYNGFNGLRHRIDWTYFTVLDGLAHPLYSIIVPLLTVGFYKNRKFMKENSQDAKVSFEEVYEEN